MFKIIDKNLYYSASRGTPQPYQPVLTEVSSSTASDGYLKMSNGMLIQWMRRSIAANSSSNLTWPIAFTTTTYGFSGTTQSTGHSDNESQSGTRTTTTLQYYNKTGVTKTFTLVGIGF